MKRVNPVATRALMTVVVAFLGLAVSSLPAGAQTLNDVGDDVDETGRYVEKPVDDELEMAIQRANDADIGFIWLDQGGDDAEQIAATVGAYLRDLGSEYRTIVVLNNDSVWVSSLGTNGAEAGSRSRELFAIGDEAGGLDLVTDTITGTSSADTSSDATASEDTATSTATDGSATAVEPTSSGGGFPWIVPIVLVALAFVAFRFFSGRRRANKQLARTLEADRLEIREQLRDNADRVIELGDRAISAGDPDMIRTYEKASATYQDVSQSIDAATTAAEIDRLDERIDEAEWQFEVIEAKLDGRPAPKSPAELAPPPPPQASDRIQQPTADQARPTVTRRGRTIPPLGDGSSTRTVERRATDRGRRSGGGLGSMMTSGIGRMLLSAAVSMLLGGVGRSSTSRRSQRRSSGGFGGNLGGGVLRRRR